MRDFDKKIKLYKSEPDSGSTKVIAFVKWRNIDREGIKYFILNRTQSFEGFIDWLQNDRLIKSVTDDINSNTIQWINFREKTRHSKDFSMKANPVYIISWSKKRGFFKLPQR